MDAKVELVGGDKLQQALNQAALDSAVNVDGMDIPVLTVTNPKVSKNSEKSGNLPVGPGPGRPKGVRNKLTNLRDAVIEAFDRVGGADYLVKLANGTQSDRAAFVSLMNKVLPTQINQSVEGGIKLELSWLGGRNIGTVQSQLTDERKQVLDLERDSAGAYRIKHPDGGTAADGGATDGGTDATAHGQDDPAKPA